MYHATRTLGRFGDMIVGGIGHGIGRNAGGAQHSPHSGAINFFGKGELYHRGAGSVAREHALVASNGGGSG